MPQQRHCGEDTESLEKFTPLGRVVQKTGEPCPEVFRGTGLTLDVMVSLLNTYFCGITGHRFSNCQIDDCSVRLDRYLLSAESVNNISGYMGMWHPTQATLLNGMYLKYTTLSRRHQMSFHENSSWSKLMGPAGRYLVWVRCPHICIFGKLK